jgi:hypothetical protein
MTTFWLSFVDPKAAPGKRFLGVAIFDMDETKREKTIVEIARRAWKLGVNPGGEMLVSETHDIPDEYKGRLITDNELLRKLGGRFGGDSSGATAHA